MEVVEAFMIEIVSQDNDNVNVFLKPKVYVEGGVMRRGGGGGFRTRGGGVA